MSVYREPPEVDTDENDIDDIYANEAWQTRRVMLATVQALSAQIADVNVPVDERVKIAGVAIDMFNCAEGRSES